MLLEIEGISIPMSGRGGGSFDNCTSDTCGGGGRGLMDEEAHDTCEGEGGEEEEGRWVTPVEWEEEQEEKEAWVYSQMLHLVMHVAENEIMEISLVNHELEKNHEGVQHQEPHCYNMTWVNHHLVNYE